MATCRQIITTALRKINQTGEGNRVPSAAEAIDALDVLNSLYEHWVDAGLFGKLTEYDADADYEAKEWERVRSNGFAVTTPTVITTDNDRIPYDLALVVVAKTSPEFHLFDALVGDWVRLDSLTLDDVAPLSNRGRDGLACALAIAITDEYGGDAGPNTKRTAAQFMMGLSEKRGGAQPVMQAEYF